MSALAALLITTWAGASFAQDDERELELDVGEQTTVAATNVLRYSEGAPGIVDVRVTEAEFIIVALRPGQTSLLLIYENGRQIRYRISVVDPNATPTGRPGSVEARENVRLDMYFVELNESYSHQIGLGFPGTIGGPGVGTANATLSLIPTSAGPAFTFTQAQLSLVNQVLPRLDLAESSGWARLRRQAMLVTANGTPARFNSGGEVNLIVAGGLTGRLEQIEFGSELRMTPRYDAATGRIEIDVQADLSELTQPESPGNPPGRRRTRLQGVVNMQPGQAIVMSGIVSRSETETQGGVPGLSQIPIVGVLFGTNARRGEATHSLLFIVPTIVQAVPRQERDYIREALHTFNRFNGYIHAYEMFEATPPGYGGPARGSSTPAQPRR